jgi:hypothetical protein
MGILRKLGHIMYSLYNVHEMNTYRADHVCLHYYNMSWDSLVSRVALCCMADVPLLVES